MHHQAFAFQLPVNSTLHRLPPVPPFRWAEAPTPYNFMFSSIHCCPQAEGKEGEDEDEGDEAEEDEENGDEDQEEEEAEEQEGGDGAGETHDRHPSMRGGPPLFTHHSRRLSSNLLTASTSVPCCRAAPHNAMPATLQWKSN